MGLRANFWKIFRSGDVIALVELLFLPYRPRVMFMDLNLTVSPL